MKQIINYKGRKQTAKKIRDLTRFIGYILHELREQGNNTLDDLNIIIFYLKGVWILSYNAPKNIRKGKTQKIAKHVHQLHHLDS